MTGIRKVYLRCLFPLPAAHSLLKLMLPLLPGKKSVRSFSESKSAEDLLSYLEMSWFYPQGFKKEKLLFDPLFIQAEGAEVVYKFVNPEALAGLGEKERWQQRLRLLQSEVELNKHSAAELFLGFRYLRWIDEEPEWISQTGTANPPESAEDLALVKLRLKPENTIFAELRDKAKLQDIQLRQLANRLVYFQRLSKSSLSRPAEDVWQAFYERISADLQVSEQAAQSVAELKRELRAARSAMQERYRQGAFIQGLSVGGLRNAYYLPREFAPRLCLYRSQLPVQSDVECDLASLSADFETLGFPQFAQRLEELYFAQSEFARSPLYELYKALALHKNSSSQWLRASVTLSRLKEPLLLVFNLEEWQGNMRSVIGLRDAICSADLSSQIGLVLASSWSKELLLELGESSAKSVICLRGKTPASSSRLLSGNKSIRERHLSPKHLTVGELWQACLSELQNG